MQLIGQYAPDFKLESWANNDFRTIELSALRGKWVVLFFYPLDFTFVCPTEIIAYDAMKNEFAKRNCELLACSVDSKFTHRAWVKTSKADGGLEGVTIPLLADLGGNVASAYGVLNDSNVAFRGLFLIDPDGIIQHVTINNLSVGRNVEDTFRILDAFQYTMQHGEVCPANWKPGSATMIADPEKSKAYFKQQA